MLAPLLLLPLLLASCAGTPPAAPVIERATTATPSAPPTVVASQRKETYTVRRGDTLHGIALEHGIDYKDLAAWNGIDNPNRIHVGQQLRVAPPDAAPVAEVRPVAGPAQVVEVRSIGSGSAKSQTDVNGGAIKREPVGGRLAYSDQAWTRLQKEPRRISEPEQTARVEAKPQENMAVAGDEDLVWAWPIQGKLIHTFSEEGNKGVDIATPYGSPVHAAAAGRVAYVGSGLRGYGNFVIIKHSENYLSAYAHNSQILVKEGQNVTRGQKIAEAGSSDADQPKLHFEIRQKGKPVDPLKYLPPR